MSQKFVNLQPINGVDEIGADMNFWNFQNRSGKIMEKSSLLPHLLILYVSAPIARKHN